MRCLLVTTLCLAVALSSLSTCAATSQTQNPDTKPAPVDQRLVGQTLKAAPTYMVIIHALLLSVDEGDLSATQIGFQKKTCQQLLSALDELLTQCAREVDKNDLAAALERMGNEFTLTIEQISIPKARKLYKAVSLAFPYRVESLLWPPFVRQMALTADQQKQTTRMVQDFHKERSLWRDPQSYNPFDFQDIEAAEEKEAELNTVYLKKARSLLSDKQLRVFDEIYGRQRE